MLLLHNESVIMPRIGSHGRGLVLLAWHSDLHKRKLTGARRKIPRGKRKFEQGGPAVQTKLGENYRVIARVRGGNHKVRVFATGVVQVSDLKTGKTRSMKILRVLENPANVDYNRRRIITKGALVDTEIGTARVTSKPGQDGVVNAVLLEPKTGS